MSRSFILGDKVAVKFVQLVTLTIGVHERVLLVGGIFSSWFTFLFLVGWVACSIV